MKSIKLQRAIKVRCWRVIGQVAEAKKRSELMPVLLRAREGGSTDASDIAGHLLFESRSRRVVAQRLLQIAEGYGLLEQRSRRYVLTDSGHTALEAEQVFVPQDGTWTIWASDDPLLASPILHVEPWAEPTAYDEVRGAKKASAPDRQFGNLPRWVQDAVGVVNSPLTDDAPLRIDQLEAEGEEVDPKATLTAAWDVSGTRLRVDGTLGDRPVNTAFKAPEVGAGAVWMQLLQAEGLWSKWDQKASALRLSFEEATPGERESLVREVIFKRPTITELGTFDETTVEGVPLRAASAQDANHWAEWRLRSRIRDYATSERFSAWTAEAVEPFSEFHPSMPTRQALAHTEWQPGADRPTPRAWHLVAAEDWGL